MDFWRTTIDPTQQDPATGDVAPGKYTGLVVSVVKGTGDPYEVSRVSFNRRVAKNPDVPFVDALTAEIEKADSACDALNDFEAEDDRLREQAEVAAREKIREILGEPPTSPA